MRSSTDETIDSDNEAPRCACPAIPWPLHISPEYSYEYTRALGRTIRDVTLIALCFRCGATWEWGEICAAPSEDDR